MWLRYLSTWRRRPPPEVAEVVGAQCMCWTSLRLPFSFCCIHCLQGREEDRLDLKSYFHNVEMGAARIGNLSAPFGLRRRAESVLWQSVGGRSDR